MLETGRFDIFLSKECISPCVGEEGCSLFVGLPRTNTAKSGFLEFKDLAPLLHCFPSPTAIKKGLARVLAKSLSFESREVFLCLSKYEDFVPLKAKFSLGNGGHLQKLEYWVRPREGLLSLFPALSARAHRWRAGGETRVRVSLAAGLTRAATPPNVGSFRPYTSRRSITYSP